MDYKKYMTSRLDGLEEDVEKHLNDWANRGYRLVQMIPRLYHAGLPTEFLCVWETL